MNFLKLSRILYSHVLKVTIIIAKYYGTENLQKFQHAKWKWFTALLWCESLPFGPKQTSVVENDPLLASYIWHQWFIPGLSPYRIIMHSLNQIYETCCFRTVSLFCCKFSCVGHFFICVSKEWVRIHWNHEFAFSSENKLNNAIKSQIWK